MSMLSSVDGKFSNLRKKLDQMGYLQPLGLESVLLVERLFNDLLHATEGLHMYKDQKTSLEEEKKHVENNIEPLQAENAKLVKENNKLNLQLLHQNEKFEETIKEYKNNARKLEHENADLRFLNTQYYHKLKALERESQQKSEQIMMIQEKNLQAVVQTSGGKKQTVAFRRQKMEIDAPLPPLVSTTVFQKVNEQYQDAYVVDMLQLADKQISQLQMENKKMLDTLAEVEDALFDFQRQVDSRDKEISRLNKMLDGGRPLEAILIEAKYTENDTVITSLQMQIECLQQENASLERKLADFEGKERVHVSSIDAENRSKVQHKKKQNAVGSDSKSLSEDLAKKQAELEKKNKSLITLLKSKDGEQVNLETLIKQLKQEKEVLEQRAKHLIANEKDLIMEIDRLSRKKVDELSQKYAPDYLRQLIQILEAQRDHYKEEVLILQSELLRKSENKEKYSGKIIVSSKTKLKSTEKVEKETKADKIIKLLEDERDYYKKHYADLEEQMRKQSKQIPNGSIDHVDKEVSAIDDELYRLREDQIELQKMRTDRDQLRIRVRELENLLRKDSSSIDEQVEKRNAEKMELENTIKKLQEELQQEKKEVMWLRNEIVLSGKSPHKPTLDAILQRLTEEKENISFELQHAIEEKRNIQLKLQEFEDKYYAEKKKLQQQIEDLKATILESEKHRTALEADLLSHKNLIASLEEQLVNLQYLWSQLQEEHKQSTAAVSQMKHLADQGEASSTQLHSQLVQKQEELHLAEDKIKSLEKQLEHLNGMIEEYNKGITSLQSEVEKVREERNQFQHLAEEKNHHLLNIQQEMFSREQQGSQFKITITAMEEQLDKFQTELREKEQLIQNLKRQLGNKSQELETYNHTQEILKKENKKLLEDLGVLTRENQTLNSELEKVCHEQETLKRQIQEYVTEVTRVEELLALKEQQRSELLQQYRSLSEENIQLETQTQQLASLNTSTELEVLSKEKELKMCRDAISALEDEIQEHLSTEQKYHLQVNTLNNSVSDLETELRQTQEIMKRLQDDLSNTRALCVQLDSTRDQLQRQKANNEAEKQQLTSQLQECQEENKILRTQITTERAAVLNLEGLLTVSREKEFRSHLTAQELAAEVKLLRDRLKENEEKLETQSKEIATYQTKGAELEMKIERLKRQVTNEKFEKERASQELKKLRQQHEFFFSQTAKRASTNFQFSPQQDIVSSSKGSRTVSTPTSSDTLVQTSSQITTKIQFSLNEGKGARDRHVDFLSFPSSEISSSSKTSSTSGIPLMKTQDTGISNCLPSFPNPQDDTPSTDSKTDQK